MQKAIAQREKRDLLSIGEASEYLGISIDTLRRWEKKERITALRSPGGHRYFQKQDLDKLFDTRYTRDAPPKKRKKDKKRASNGQSELAVKKTTKAIDWSERYTDKKPREVVIPLSQPISITVQKQESTNTLIPQTPQQTATFPVSALPQHTHQNTSAATAETTSQKTKKIVVTIIIITLLLCFVILMYLYPKPQILSPIP
ncbi:MAG: MerR family transcriptional regulator [Candidatus Hermodarchaeia archaeon]|jgi:excisionase family DNA binding protein